MKYMTATNNVDKCWRGNQNEEKGCNNKNDSALLPYERQGSIVTYVTAVASAEKGARCALIFVLVEVTGFEPMASWSRTKRATKLRYTSPQLI